MTRRETRTAGFARRSLAAVVVLLAAVLVAAPVTARAQVRIADGTTCSLTVERCPVEGQAFHLAQLASMDAAGRLTAVPALADAVAETGIDPATFDEGTTGEILSRAATSYAGYVASAAGSFVERDAKAAAATAGSAAADGKAGLSASFAGLEPGMYLLTADPATANGTTYTMLPALVIVPRVDGSTYATDCQVEAKFEEQPQERPHNRVTKLWQRDSASTRPDSVRVAIYDGDQPYREVTLDASNNWTYEWDGEGSWSVREKDVPAGYACSVLMASASVNAGQAGSGQATSGQATAAQAGTDFTLTNKATSETPQETPRGTRGTTKTGPKTGDATSTLLPEVLLCAGGALLIFGLAGRRKEKNRA